MITVDLSHFAEKLIKETQEVLFNPIDGVTFKEVVARCFGSFALQVSAVGLTSFLCCVAYVSAADLPLDELTQGMIDEMRFLKEETVVTAIRREQPISEAPSNIYVITDEDIRQSGATDVPTVLRRVPGLEVMQMTGADINVSARGDNQPFANKLLVLVDGRSIYIDAQGTLFWKLLPVTMPEIKRIEVLKGPASAIYGFNAFDGVINIITKSPEEMKGTLVQVGGGEFGTWMSSAIHAGVQGKFGYRLSYGEDQAQQWRNRNALAFRSNKINAHTEYAISPESRLIVAGGFIKATRFDGQVGETVAESIQPAQWYGHAAYERPNFFIRTWWNGLSDKGVQSANPLLANFVQLTDFSGDPKFSDHANTYNIEAQHTIELGNSHQMSYGVNYRYNTYVSNVVNYGFENRLGIYVQDAWRITEKTTLNAGVRYDLDTFIHPTISPRVTLLYKVSSNHVLHVSGSVAYRPPTIIETHLNEQAIVTLPLPPPFNTSTNPVSGSLNLAPEEIVSYEVGYQGWLYQHRIRLRGDIFFNHITNLINSRNTSAGVATFVNDPGQADIYGGEAGVEFLATQWLTGFTNFSYEQIGQSFTDTVRRGAPRFKVNAGLRGDWDSGLNTEAVIYHVGAATYPIAATFFRLEPFFPPGVLPPNTRVDSYNLLNLRLGYRFWHDKAEFAVSAFNALNDHHKEHPLGDTIGSRVMGWLTLKL